MNMLSVSEKDSKVYWDDISFRIDDGNTTAKRLGECGMRSPREEIDSNNDRRRRVI